MDGTGERIPEELVEKVARAIAMGRGLEAGQWRHFVESARAAIRVMRKETSLWQ